MRWRKRFDVWDGHVEDVGEGIGMHKNHFYVNDLVRTVYSPKLEWRVVQMHDKGALLVVEEPGNSVQFFPYGDIVGIVPRKAEPGRFYRGAESGYRYVGLANGRLRYLGEIPYSNFSIEMQDGIRLEEEK